MTNAQTLSSLEGKLLIAMPGMGDPRFDRSVVFLCSHDDEGAMGLIINKPSAEVTFAALMEQLKLTTADRLPEIPIYFGGPVEMGRGFILHSRAEYQNASTLAIDEHVGMTATLDILEDIATGQGPEHVILALGYSGWGPGQLESEIMENGWLTCDASPDLIFGATNEDKWSAALASLGVDPLTLSSSAGRA